jgi:pyrroloquinoline quinone (PQQ) biosynthesis protein C
VAGNGRSVRSNPTVNAFHNFLTDIGANAPFASAVAATNYAVEGVTRRIAAKALQGLQDNEHLKSQGREWLMEHATCDDEHAIVAMELVKTCGAQPHPRLGAPEYAAASGCNGRELPHVI